MLRAILASRQPDRCRRAQAFISTQGLEPDTVAELVAEEVTRELLTPSEGTGTPPDRPPQPLRAHSQVPAVRTWVLRPYASHTLPSDVARLHLPGEHVAFMLLLFVDCFRINP